MDEFVGSSVEIVVKDVKGGCMPSKDGLFCLACDVGDISDAESHAVVCKRAHSILSDLKTAICLAAVGNCQNSISFGVKEAVIDLLRGKEVVGKTGIISAAGGGGIVPGVVAQQGFKLVTSIFLLMTLQKMRMQHLSVLPIYAGTRCEKRVERFKRYQNGLVSGETLLTLSIFYNPWKL